MKLNIALPSNGTQKLLDIDDEKKVRIFYDKKLSAEVPADELGDEFKGYVLKIAGGNDKQGFPMKQGILQNGRVRLLLGTGHSCYRPRRSGERRRKSVRGCIVGPDIAVLNLVVVKKGEQDIAGLTDRYVPNRLGPKRANNIRKLFNLSKDDDVRKYVTRRELPQKEGKKKQTVAPKIQRLITPRTLQRKRHILAAKRARSTKSKAEAAAYAKLLAQRVQESREKRSKLVSARRSERLSVKEGEKKEAKKDTKAVKAVAVKEVPKKDVKAAPKAAAKQAAAPAKVAAKEAPKAVAPKAAAKQAAAPAKAAPKAAAPKAAAPKTAAPKAAAKKGGKK